MKTLKIVIITIIVLSGVLFLTIKDIKEKNTHDQLTHDIEMAAVNMTKFNDSIKEAKNNRRNDEILELTRMGCKAYLRADGTYTVVKPDGSIITI